MSCITLHIHKLFNQYPATLSKFTSVSILSYVLLHKNCSNFESYPLPPPPYFAAARHDAAASARVKQACDQSSGACASEENLFLKKSKFDID
jgi:hypothetical protein